MKTGAGISSFVVPSTSASSLRLRRSDLDLADQTELADERRRSVEPMVDSEGSEGRRCIARCSIGILDDEAARVWRALDALLALNAGSSHTSSLLLRLGRLVRSLSSAYPATHSEKLTRRTGSAGWSR